MEFDPAIVAKCDQLLKLFDEAPASVQREVMADVLFENFAMRSMLYATTSKGHGKINHVIANIATAIKEALQ